MHWQLPIAANIGLSTDVNLNVVQQRPLTYDATDDAVDDDALRRQRQTTTRPATTQRAQPLTTTTTT